MMGIEFGFAKSNHSYMMFAGWWFGTWLLFFHSVGNVIIPTDLLHDFSEG